MHRFFKLFLSCLLLAASLAQAHAQGVAREAWLGRIVEEVRELQLRPACFGRVLPETLHILGVVGSRDLIDEAMQIELLGKINEVLSSTTRLRVTKADTFQFIATSRALPGQAKVGEIQELLARSDAADITLTLRPYAASGGRLDAEVILWARDQAGTGVTCTPSFVVAIATSDPRCAGAFETAVAADGVAQLEAFKAFFPDCPEAAEVDQVIAERREREAQVACEAAFNAAVVANAVPAFDRFLAEHPNCRLHPTAQKIRDQLASQATQRRTCDDAYNLAKSANSADAYALFAERYPQCREAGLAAELAQLRRQEAERAAQQAANQQVALAPRQAAPAAPRADNRAVLRQPDPMAQRIFCRVADVRPPDSWLALRTEPSTRRGSRLRRLPSGTWIEMLGEVSGDWHRVRIEDGTVGWVSWARDRWIAC